MLKLNIKPYGLALLLLFGSVIVYCSQDPHNNNGGFKEPLKPSGKERKHKESTGKGAADGKVGSTNQVGHLEDRQESMIVKRQGRKVDRNVDTTVVRSIRERSIIDQKSSKKRHVSKFDLKIEYVQTVYEITEFVLETYRSFIIKELVTDEEIVHNETDSTNITIEEFAYKNILEVFKAKKIEFEIKLLKLCEMEVKFEKLGIIAKVNEPSPPSKEHEPTINSIAEIPVARVKEKVEVSEATVNSIAQLEVEQEMSENTINSVIEMRVQKDAVLLKVSEPTINSIAEISVARVKEKVEVSEATANSIAQLDVKKEESAEVSEATANSIAKLEVEQEVSENTINSVTEPSVQKDTVLLKASEPTINSIAELPVDRVKESAKVSEVTANSITQLDIKKEESAEILETTANSIAQLNVKQEVSENTINSVAELSVQKDTVLLKASEPTINSIAELPVDRVKESTEVSETTFNSIAQLGVKKEESAEVSETTANSIIQLDVKKEEKLEMSENLISISKTKDVIEDSIKSEYGEYLLPIQRFESLHSISTLPVEREELSFSEATIREISITHNVIDVDKPSSLVTVKKYPKGELLKLSLVQRSSLLKVSSIKRPMSVLVPLEMKQVLPLPQMVKCPKAESCVSGCMELFTSPLSQADMFKYMLIGERQLVAPNKPGAYAALLKLEPIFKRIKESKMFSKDPKALEGLFHEINLQGKDDNCCYIFECIKTCFEPDCLPKPKEKENELLKEIMEECESTVITKEDELVKAELNESTSIIAVKENDMTVADLYQSEAGFVKENVLAKAELIESESVVFMQNNELISLAIESKETKSNELLVVDLLNSQKKAKSKKQDELKSMSLREIVSLAKSPTLNELISAKLRLELESIAKEDPEKSTILWTTPPQHTVSETTFVRPAKPRKRIFVLARPRRKRRVCRVACCMPCIPSCFKTRRRCCFRSWNRRLGSRVIPRSNIRPASNSLKKGYHRSSLRIIPFRK